MQAKEIIKEFVEKVKEKAANSKEFTVNYKYDNTSALYGEIVWFELKTEDYKIYICKSMHGISLYEAVKDDEEEDEEYKFKRINCKSAKHNDEDLLSVIEEIVDQLKHQRVYKRASIRCVNA